MSSSAQPLQAPVAAAAAVAASQPAPAAAAAVPQAVPYAAQPPKAAVPHASSTASAVRQQPLQQQQQHQHKQQQAVQPKAVTQLPTATPVDLVIDEVFGGDMGMEERDRRIDEMAYGYYSTVREAAGGQLDPEASAQLNQLAAMTQADKDAILQKTNRVARKVMRPLGYKVLQVQGLDPATVSAAAAREALEADLTPQQQAEVDAEAERLFKEVYVPELQAAAEELSLSDPDEAWEQFGREVMARRPEEPPQQSTVAVALPAALAGAVVALVVAKLFGWLQRRRQRHHPEQWGSEQYEDEFEEELVTDSGLDDASAYAE